MIEKVNPSHPDKVADRIAGALVDLAYTKEENPKIAVEVLLGHGDCNIIAESSVDINKEEVEKIVKRITGVNLNINYKLVPQDIHLAENQKGKFKCGDNGIFKGVPLTEEEKILSELVKTLYEKYPYDGKFILDLDTNKLVICQSNVEKETLKKELKHKGDLRVIINPLGYWTGGLDVDSGATNRKLGSDMAQSVTGGGLHGKDLSKADVSLNIFAFKKAQETGKPVQISCAIGDRFVTGTGGKEFAEIVEEARKYIKEVGGFEKFAEWGLY